MPAAFPWLFFHLLLIKLCSATDFTQEKGLPASLQHGKLKVAVSNECLELIHNPLNLLGISAWFEVV